MSASVLVIFSCTDALLSALLASQTLRGYIVDSTQTRLPLMAFCSSAQCEISAETRFNVVILTPLKAKLFSLPVVAAGLGIVLAMGWDSAIAITPWFNLVGSRYLGYGSVLLSVRLCCLLPPSTSSTAGKLQDWCEWDGRFWQQFLPPSIPAYSRCQLVLGFRV